MSFLRKIYTCDFLILLIIMQSTVILSACTTFISCETKAENQSLESWLDSKVPCLLNKYKVPGAAVAIVRDGELVFSNGWGVKRIGERSQVNEQTLFPAASLTKPVFAYGALVLVRDGRLDLDHSLSEYLDEPYVQGDDRLHLFPLGRNGTVLSGSIDEGQRDRADSLSGLLLMPSRS